ncbi:VOC family protein [Bradymonadaceae bacterium TMQ3]|uniref:VOC family protein n=1 Tax=Lujinxingia sediminis TaxID=2480984 RepID=A0ABY0CX15_9DELT|nr:VOC family protein [Lujinxingia sediminis]RDV39830.1 VOC family protein [Bradymonadaceae bacterium TMQ3]RVU48126.1 VOC family protein [Lujinxingia sediminis]TXC77425.1 VOC family protein [Bradymonadales bacterium TMQ1]
MLGLRTVIYPVDDLKAATAWYSEAFGVEPYYSTEYYVGFDVHGYELGLMPADGDLKPSLGGSETLWGVEDIQASFQRLIALGATALVEPWNTGEEIWVASLADPFGNRLGLIFNPHFRVAQVPSLHELQESATKS